jgi:DNA repair exonuclease SbcCD ATPase subunit
MAKTLEELQQELEAVQRLKGEYEDLRRELLRRKQDADTDADKAAALQAEYDALGQALSGVASQISAATTALNDYRSAQAAGKATQDDLISGFVKTTTSLGSLGARYQRLTSETLPGFVSGLFNGANALQNLGAIGNKVIDMFAEFGIQQDKVIAQFRANTGAGEEFNQVIRDTALANIQAGVGLEDTVAAITALKNEFTDFTYLNQEQQLEVAETTTLLNKLGFSFSTQASIIQDATQALGKDVAEAQELFA